MGIVVIGASFVDVKGYPLAQYISGGRNVGRVVQVHGGVGRNVVEDIANVELRPTFVSVVDDSGLSDDVVRNLIRHKVEIRYIARNPEGLGTWLAVFNNEGDVIASISRRPDLSALEGVLDEARSDHENFRACLQSSGSRDALHRGLFQHHTGRTSEDAVQKNLSRTHSEDHRDNGRDRRSVR